jgi:predicted metalloprotease with PDZ domain
MLLHLFLSTLALAPRPYRIAYTFSSLEPATHLADVRVEVGAREVDTVAFQLPAWYPGRYAIYNYAANLQEPAAWCGGRPAEPQQRDKTTWVLRCAAARPATFAYRVWWNDLNGSFSQIDSTHIDLNPGNTFVYVVGHKPDPVTVRYEGPPGWRVMSGDPAPGPTYRFPNYDVMIDHPTEISDAFTTDSFVVGKVTYRMLLHAAGDPGPMRPRLQRDIERIVRADVAMWGDPPIPSYTFLVHFLPGSDADGMEHLTSTQLVFDDSLAALPDSAYLDRMEAIAHEFFQTWNMKRLRARELGPWDYTRENPTTTLWIGEGITNYYGARSVHRSGIWDADHYLARVAGAVTTLQSKPGRHLMSARQSSFNAWRFDRVTLRQRTNLKATTISYYNKGELIGWLLDLDIRARTGGKKTLDDVMRLMWRRFWLGPRASYYLQGRGYRDADFLQSVKDVSGADYADFYRRYIDGVEELPYAEILGKVGLTLADSAGRYRLALDSTATGAELGRAWLEGR